MSAYTPHHLRALRQKVATSPAATPAKKKRAPRKQAPAVPLPASTWTGDTLSIIVPIPPLALRPNDGHGHWRSIHKARKTAQTRARLATLESLGGRTAPVPTAYTLVYHFRRTAWDDDNAIASVKSYLDGISTALGIDDKTLRFRELIRAKDAGCPRVEIRMHLSLSSGAGVPSGTPPVASVRPADATTTIKGVCVASAAGGEALSKKCRVGSDQ